MILNLIFIIYTFAVFFAVIWFSEKFTVSWLPSWLDYKPFNCSKCLSFWLMGTIYVISSYLLEWNLLILILGLTLTILNTIAKIIDERRRIIL